MRYNTDTAWQPVDNVSTTCTPCSQQILHVPSTLPQHINAPIQIWATKGEMDGVPGGKDGNGIRHAWSNCPSVSVCLCECVVCRCTAKSISLVLVGKCRKNVGLDTNAYFRAVDEKMWWIILMTKKNWRPLEGQRISISISISKNKFFGMRKRILLSPPPLSRRSPMQMYIKYVY